VAKLRKYANGESMGKAAQRRRANGFFTISETSHRIGGCRETTALAVKLGGIPCVTIGRRRYIRAETIAELIETPSRITRVFEQISQALEKPV
jgi:hypothetical protein